MFSTKKQKSQSRSIQSLTALSALHPRDQAVFAVTAFPDSPWCSKRQMIPAQISHMSAVVWDGILLTKEIHWSSA